MSNVFLIRQDLSRSVSMSDIFAAKDSKDLNDETFKSLFDDAKKKYLKKTKDQQYAVFEQCKATHLGYVNANNSLYPAEYGRQNADSWTTPFEKPVLINHDLLGEPLGRHVHSEYVPFTLSDAQMRNIKVPKGVVLTHSVITDWNAMTKILDKRYLTVSVSGTSTNCKCSICGQDWMNLKDGEDMCRHIPGDYYDGKLCYKITGAITYTERSFVNNPADQSKAHVARLTNYEMIVPETHVKDEQYIAQNMLSSRESAVIRDSAGYSLFLAQDENGNYPKGKPFYAFSMGSKIDVIDSTVGESDNGDIDSNIDRVLPNQGQSGANLSTSSDKVGSQNNVQNNYKEQAVMDWNSISVQNALENVVGLKAHIDQLVAQDVQAKVADALSEKEKAVIDLEAVKAELADSKTKLEALTTQSIAATTDSIITLMADLKKPQYEKLVKDASGDAQKLTESLKAYHDKLAARGLSSLQDMLGDLREEASYAATAVSDSAADPSLAKPAGDGIAQTVESTTQVSDNRTDVQTVEDSTKVTKPVAKRRGLPITI